MFIWPFWIWEQCNSLSFWFVFLKISAWKKRFFCITKRRGPLPASGCFGFKYFFFLFQQYDVVWYSTGKNGKNGIKKQVWHIYILGCHERVWVKMKWVIFKAVLYLIRDEKNHSPRFGFLLTSRASFDFTRWSYLVRFGNMAIWIHTRTGMAYS